MIGHSAALIGHGAVAWLGHGAALILAARVGVPWSWYTECVELSVDEYVCIDPGLGRAVQCSVSGA